MKPVHLTKKEFLTRIADIENHPKEWIFLGQRPAIVDFYATWCGPCKALSPVLEEVAEQYAGRIDVYKVNVDEEDELATLFQIRSIPTLLFIPMTGKPQMAHGALPKFSMVEVIEKVLL